MRRALYELAGADPELCFSPFCWRIKLALAHKNLAYDTIPWRFTDKEEIAFSGQGSVPVLIDGDEVRHDSQTIAEYLEAAYPDEASLFGDGASAALTRFVKQWTETILMSAIVKIVLPDIFGLIDPKDRVYFQQTREARFGMTMQAMAAARESHMPALHAALVPLRKTLQAQKFFAGETPAYADHIVFGALQWARLTSSTPLLEEDDPISHWMTRVLSSYGM